MKRKLEICSLHSCLEVNLGVVLLGHEYFQWMNAISQGSFKEQEQRILLSRPLKAEGLSQSGNVDAEGSTIPPIVSDMDIEGLIHCFTKI